MAARRKKPLNGSEPWMRLWDETSPRSSDAEKDVERLREPEDGT